MNNDGDLWYEFDIIYYIILIIWYDIIILYIIIITWYDTYYDITI